VHCERAPSWEGSDCIQASLPFGSQAALALADLAQGRSGSRREAIATARVVPQSIRCVQCGICSYNCPVGINVRAHAAVGAPVSSAHCLSCGECVRRCPRGVLRLETTPLFADSDPQQELF
jgi:ferredoxin